MVAQIDICKSILLLLYSQESSLERYLILSIGYGLMGVISFGYMQWNFQRLKKTLHVCIELVPRLKNAFAYLLGLHMLKKTLHVYIDLVLHFKKCICVFIGIAPVI